MVNTQIIADPKQQRIIGLTGGIATGKTTVSSYLAQHYKLPVLDADVYSKEAVSQNSSILKEIFTRYGDRVKLADGNLNRSVLGDIIFTDSAERLWLESKIHPVVRDRFVLEQQRLDNQTIVFAIPLLFEANLTHLVTEIWVVSCDRKTQLSRLQQRNNLTLQQALTRINSQLPLSEKIAQADVVLENNSTLEDLYRQCDLHIEH
ncbi:dephospho-CoA kinase [Xenococcus sp. PCC 7305]|uniref:dephospho-CoA kinase n=1 Tax=Xenococcus sp. PCC 7305 TaxID=102125 RepID=UPI0002ABD740|nr:dephospho-CoA kinase [Xenococcus sp. PCC 7305]ELS01626.1 dephospho-CoA kinase [Xenococcus sp. PCC 7305]